MEYGVWTNIDVMYVVGSIVIGVETFVLGVHVLELGEHPLDDVVLLQALQRVVLDGRHGRPGHRIEQLLLDRGVDRKLLDDAVDDLPLLDEGPRPLAGVVAGEDRHADLRVDAHRVALRHALAGCRCVCCPES